VLLDFGIEQLCSQSTVILQQYDEKCLQQTCSRRRSPKVVASVSESSPKSSRAPKPNFSSPTAAKSGPIGAFSPNLAILVFMSDGVDMPSYLAV